MENVGGAVGSVIYRYTGTTKHARGPRKWLQCRLTHHEACPHSGRCEAVHEIHLCPSGQGTVQGIDDACGPHSAQHSHDGTFLIEQKNNKGYMYRA